MQQTHEHVDIALISYDEPPKVGDPGETALDYISSLVAIPESVVLPVDVSVILSVRRQEINTALSESLSGGVAVVSLVADHSCRSGPWSSWSLFGDSDVSKRLIKELDLSRRGRVGMASERNTLACAQYQELYPLSRLGLPDSRALFFAGKKVASTKTSSQSRIPS